jgi:FixJ family two-component response regulator
MSEGADGFVNKPYHIEALDRAVQKAQRSDKRRE